VSVGCAARTSPRPLALPRFQLVGIASNQAVDLATQLKVDAGRLTRDDGGGPFGDPTSPPRGPGVREFVDDHLGETQVSLTSMGRLATGVRELGGDPTAASRRRHSPESSSVTLGGVELRGQLRLRGGRNAHELLQSPDRSDPRGVIETGRVAEGGAEADRHALHARLGQHVVSKALTCVFSRIFEHAFTLDWSADIPG
jgi:hypothetical protein